MKRQTRWMLSAVMAAAPVLGAARFAEAQFQAGQDGHALDASNQTGSGGRNGPRSSGGSTGASVSGNQIITGNVTAGRAFQGAVDYTDPRAFRGTSVGGVTDSFVKNSYGVPTRYGPSIPLYTPTSFYGDARFVPPPVGTVREGPTKTYFGTALQPANATSVASGLIEYQSQNPGGLTVIGLAPRSLAAGDPVTLPALGQQQESLFLGSPLLGTRQVAQGAAEALPGQANAQNGNATGVLQLPAQPQLPGAPANPPSPTDRFSSQTDILRMREELQRAADENAQNPQNPQNPDNAGNPPGQGPEGQPGNANRPPGITPKPLGSRLNSSLPERRLENALNPSPVSEGAAPGGVRQRLVVPASQQSTLYKNLQRRFAEYNAQHPVSDQEANRQFRRLKQAQAAAAAGQAGAGGNLSGLQGGAGGAATRPGAAPHAGRPPANAAAVQAQGAPAAGAGGNAGGAPAAPIHVKSLAEGVKATGLHDLLTKAEKEMQEGKFASAIQTYAEAQNVAPNNPLITLGHANAALGASFYTRAEFDLRRAISTDPALLMGQYDLKAMMNADRLQFVQKDLQGLASADPRQARPLLLLAYIAYNTGDPQAAARDLDDAQKRVGRDDPLIETMRTYWNLPKPAAAQELNK